ncbi:MAG TPA: hypothetical protein VFW88_07020, partial [Burkholderiales bacterium]|nr:hypothetical protein [Burkholderiales bacterium]
MTKIRVPIRGSSRFGRVDTDATNGAQLGVNLYDENGNLLTSADVLNKLLTVNGAALKKFIDRDGTITADALQADKIISGRINQWVKALENGQITSDSVLNGAIGTLALAEGAITSDKIAALAITAAALADGAVDFSKFASGLTPAAVVDSLPDPAGYTGPSLVFLTTDAVLYRYDASVPSWTSAIATADIPDSAITTAKIAADAITAALVADGAIGTLALAANAVSTENIAAGAVEASQIASGAVELSKFADGITPVEIVGTLPATGNYDGRTVFLSTDKKLYRYNGTASAWTKALDGADIIANSITAGAISAGAIDASKIAANTITADNIAAGAIESAAIAAGAVVAASISAGAVDASKIEANTITAGQIAAGAIGATELAADSVEAGSIAAGAVVTVAIAAGAVTADKISVGELSAIIANAGILSAGVLVDSSATAPDYTDYHLAFDMDDQILEMKDASGNTRVLMGQTSPGVYNFEIADADGNLLFDADGISD